MNFRRNHAWAIPPLRHCTCFATTQCSQTPYSMVSILQGCRYIPPGAEASWMFLSHHIARGYSFNWFFKQSSCICKCHWYGKHTSIIMHNYFDATFSEEAGLKALGHTWSIPSVPMQRSRFPKIANRITGIHYSTAGTFRFLCQLLAPSLFFTLHLLF